jgi:hypothetical protein
VVRPRVAVSWFHPKVRRIVSKFDSLLTLLFRLFDSLPLLKRLGCAFLVRACRW